MTHPHHSPSTLVSSQIRVLFSNDHPFLREGLAAVLNYKPDMKVVEQACNGQEAVELFRQHQPDVTLMDLRMSKLSGVEAIATICGEFADARIIVLTTYDRDKDIYRGLRAGAKGYVLKDAEPDELLTAIPAVYNGQQYIPAAVGAKLAERMRSAELSERELEVLRLMATGKSNLERCYLPACSQFRAVFFH
ncbi:MAG: response regulator transcription factor [Nostoc sp.]|uniref:response regulator transcription factor n=1 Tax=Nostoc sp. TaxID=1180 RepID=UPI002FF0674C